MSVIPEKKALTRLISNLLSAGISMMAIIPATQLSKMAERKGKEAWAMCIG
jgi:hypothetical protein